MCKGHTKLERPNLQNRSDDKLNLVALLGKESGEELESDSDSDHDG